MAEIIWLVFSYILGSFPSGYIFSRLSKKNILEIGWRKTSGSNVFKNVGIWQGTLTGIFDIAKGYLAVYGAQKLGLPIEVQALSGVSAIVGHNWSLFLGFSGGRGIGTFIGAFAVFSWQILLLSLFPFLVLSIIWDAAIGTLLFLASAILFMFYSGQLGGIGSFAIFSLAPIFIKRLSPLIGIGASKNKKSLIISRLIFDDDKPHLELRIKRFLARRKEKIAFRLGPDDLKKMMIAASKKIVFCQEEINRINVFPVADKDTGYNLAATLSGIEKVISSKNYSTIREIAEDMETAAISNARGNAGMIYAGYLQEILERIKQLEMIDAFHLADAMKNGIQAARLTVLEPVEGTILDVIQAVGEKAFELAGLGKEKNIIKVLEEAKKAGEISLAKTKNKLEILRKNNVADAGALGFVKILEAWIECLRGTVPLPEKKVESVVLAPPTKEELKYRYDLVFCLKENEQLDILEIIKELSFLGDSIDILKSENRVKIHIHTNLPEEVKEKIRDFQILEWQVKDMAGV